MPGMKQLLLAICLVCATCNPAHADQYPEPFNVEVLTEFCKDEPHACASAIVQYLKSIYKLQKKLRQCKKQKSK